MMPAIGASTIGNSVLKRSMIRRSGHMVLLAGGVRVWVASSGGGGGRSPIIIWSAWVTILSTISATGGTSWISPTASPAMTAAISKLPARLRRRIFGRDGFVAFCMSSTSRPIQRRACSLIGSAPGKRRRPDIVARQIEDDAADAVSRWSPRKFSLRFPPGPSHSWLA